MGKEQSAPQPAKPKKWWQWVLVYPAVATTLLASAPTYLELARSTAFGVPLWKSSDAAEQHELWRRNLDCTTAPFDWLTTPTNIKVDATICESGDVVVRAKVPGARSGEESFYRWVPVSQLVNPVSAFPFARPAYAANQPPVDRKYHDREPILMAQLRVLCQRWLDRVLLLRRVATPRGCVDEVVNTYTGYVVRVQPAPCNSRC